MIMAQKALRGEEIAPGIASGMLCFINAEMAPSLLGDKRVAQDIGQEIERLEREVESVIEDLMEAVNLLRMQTYDQEAEIVETHILSPPISAPF